MAIPISSLHFVMIPLMAQGHMIPMFDIARLLAERGVKTTIYTTPMNVARFKPTVDRASELGLPVQLVEIQFPWKEVGLPEGCENLDALPSPGLLRNFHCGLEKMKEPIERHMAEQTPVPSCIIADRTFFWTLEVSKTFGIPRFLFNGMGCFSRLAIHNVENSFPDGSVLSENESFEVPGMPKTFTVKKLMLPASFKKHPNLDDFRTKVEKAELEADGLIVNSFKELGHGCVELYEKAISQKIWCIGPVSLCNRVLPDRVDRGNKASDEVQRIMQWLDTMESKSVVYACLGSLCRLVPKQLIELGKGLEASGRPFIWVVKTGGDRGSELEKWLEDENFEERIRGKGFVIRGWAPQAAILSHVSVGGFLTHCGWNSTLEGICSKIPLITWPLFAEQFLNEALVVDVLGIGVRVGVDRAVRFGEEDKAGVLVKEEHVSDAVEAIMCCDEEGEKRRERAREIGDKAIEAVGEGGSSYSGLSNLIHYVMEESAKGKKNLIHAENMVNESTPSP